MLWNESSYYYWRSVLCVYHEVSSSNFSNVAGLFVKGKRILEETSRNTRHRYAVRGCEMIEEDLDCSWTGIVQVQGNQILMEPTRRNKKNQLKEL
jgi:hypothetical protein